MKKAMLNPESVFNDPQKVVMSEELTNEQKINILRRWEYDAHQMEVAEEEAGMTLKRPEMFDLVVRALHTLGSARDTEHTPPTK
jgi:hypothetical protein